jgi:hypothetical protein
VRQIDKLKFNMHTHDDDIAGLYSTLNPGTCTQVESEIITALTKIPNMQSKLNNFPTLVKSHMHGTENSNMHVTEYSNMHVQAEYSNTHRLLNIPTHIG